MRIRVVQYRDNETKEPTDFYYYEVSRNGQTYSNRCFTRQEVMTQLSMDLENFLRDYNHLNIDVK